MAYIQPRKNKDGKIISYSIKVFRGRDMYGKQLKPYTKTFKVNPAWSEVKNFKEAQNTAALFEKQCKDGLVADNKQTFEKYANYVINLKENNGLKHRTIVRYKELLKRINNEIGHLKLSEIKPQHLNILYTKLSTNGINKSTKGKLSNKTIIEHHRLIRTILNQADKEMLVTYNAALKAEPPKLIKKEANYFEIEDIERILFYAKQEPLKKQVMINLLVFSGCRRGEIMGLKWNKVDFKNQNIFIDNNLLYSKEKGIYEDTPKTEKSKRIIKLPEKVMNLLKEYKKEYNAKKLSLGSTWYDTNFVFTQENGKPMHPDTLTDYCNKFTKKYNEIIEKDNKNKPKNTQIKLLPHINPHAFRHSQASILLKSGVNIADISTNLGHSNLMTTLNIYSHVLEKANERVSNTLENVLLNKDEIKSSIAN